MLQVITSEGCTSWRCTNLVLCVHAADHAVAAKLLFDRAIAAVWTLSEPHAHHFFCSLFIPNLRRVSDVVSSVCLQDSSRSAHSRCNWFCCVPFVFDRDGCMVGESRTQRNLAQYFLAKQSGVTKLKRAPHLYGRFGCVAIDARMCVALTSGTDGAPALQTLGFIRLC